jgi:SET domain-containing protein
MFKEGRSSYPKIFISHKIEVKESPIHGWGVFAKERIERHELIEAAAVIVFHRASFDSSSDDEEGAYVTGTPGNMRLGGLHDRHVVLDYTFDWNPPIVAFALGWGGVYNHSTENPTAVFRRNIEYECIDFYTRHIIEPGEEITIRYVPYRYCDKLWFASDEDNSLLDKPVDTVMPSIDGGLEQIRHKIK